MQITAIKVSELPSVATPITASLLKENVDLFKEESNFDVEDVEFVLKDLKTMEQLFVSSSESEPFLKESAIFKMLNITNCVYSLDYLNRYQVIQYFPTSHQQALFLIDNQAEHSNKHFVFERNIDICNVVEKGGLELFDGTILCLVIMDKQKRLLGVLDISLIEQVIYYAYSCEDSFLKTSLFQGYSSPMDVVNEFKKIFNGQGQLSSLVSKVAIQYLIIFCIVWLIQINPLQYPNSSSFDYLNIEPNDSLKTGLVEDKLVFEYGAEDVTAQNESTGLSAYVSRMFLLTHTELGELNNVMNSKFMVGILLNR